MAKEFNPGYGNLGYCEVRSLYEAKEIFTELGIPWEIAVQQHFGDTRDWFGRIKHDDGIHIYFMDKDCTKDYGYYTPLMSSVIINAEPRPWGIQPNLVEV